MHIHRDATLKRAAKLLRQGKLDAAIAEYVQLTTAMPGDTSSVNALGDLYVQAGQLERAVAQFARAAEQLAREGAATKAAAVYKKILRISPGDEGATRALEGLGAKRKQRRRKGPAMPPDDPDARMTAARDAQDASDVGRACALLIEAADLYESKGRHADALAAVAEASSIDPANEDHRLRMLKMLIAQGELVQARCVARVPAELVMVAQALEAAGRPTEAAETRAEAAGVDPENQATAAFVAPAAPASAPSALREIAGADTAAGFDTVDAAADEAAAAGEWHRAISILEEFVTREPEHVPALLKVIEVCIDGRLSDRIPPAQERLVDAYLNAGRGAEARVIAEDLVMQTPWVEARVERLIRALVLCTDPEPEQTIANLLSSEGSFMREDR